MNTEGLARLRQQLGDHEAMSLASVLDDLTDRVHSVLADTLAGVYVKGSFALGSGDVHAGTWGGPGTTTPKCSGGYCATERFASVALIPPP